MELYHKFRRNHFPRAQRERGSTRDVFRRVAIDEIIQVPGHILPTTPSVIAWACRSAAPTWSSGAPYLAQIRRKYGWRSLTGTQAEVVSGRSDGTPHHVTVHVDATYNRRHHRWEGRGIARRAIEGVGRQ